MIKISIIIPVYNVENYLKRCLDSVCNQTLKDIEIICVDDCSPDNSIKILREYAEKDSRVKIINFSENKGVSTARNTAINSAKGDYIGFIDSDDYINLDFYEKLYERAVKNNSDITKGADCELVYPDGTVFHTKQNEKIRENKIAFCYQFYTAIYKTVFLRKHHLNFPEDCSNFEDPVFALQASYFANQVDIVEEAVYHYMRRDDCQSNKAWSKEQLLSYIKYINYLTDFEEKQAFSNIEYNMFYSFILNSIHNVKKYRSQNDEECKKILSKLYIQNVLKKEKRKHAK